VTIKNIFRKKASQRRSLFLCYLNSINCLAALRAGKKEAKKAIIVAVKVTSRKSDA
jgi:hypothetical protein